MTLLRMAHLTDKRCERRLFGAGALRLWFFTNTLHHIGVTPAEGLTRLIAMFQAKYLGKVALISEN